MQPHRRLRAAALALAACAALAAPAAAAPPGATYPQPSSAKIGDTPADYAGQPANSEPAGAAPTRASDAGGLDWPSALLGAAGAGLVIVVSLGGASVLWRRRMRVAR